MICTFHNGALLIIRANYLALIIPNSTISHNKQMFIRRLHKELIWTSGLRVGGSELPPIYPVGCLSPGDD